MADTPVIRTKRGHVQSKQSDCDENVIAKKIKKSVTFGVSCIYSLYRNTASLFLYTNKCIRSNKILLITFRKMMIQLAQKLKDGKLKSILKKYSEEDTLNKSFSVSRLY